MAVELDDRVSLAGAEGIDLDLTLAGLPSRGAAVILDLAAQTLAMVVIGFVAGQFGDAGVALFAVGAFLVIFGYPVIGEAFLGGRTLGKAAMRIAVVDQRGGPASFLAVLIRNVVRLIDLLPGLYLVGATSILATARNQRLGDLAAGTLVVRRGGVQTPVGGAVAYGAGLGQPAIEAPFGVSPGAPMTWDVSQVTADEVAAMRSFLGRRHQLTPQHRAQLAQTLSFQVLPKVAGVPLEGGPEVFIERVVHAKTTGSAG